MVLAIGEVRSFCCPSSANVVEYVDQPRAVPQLPVIKKAKTTPMYEHVFQFFGLRENPFHVSPDPRFFSSTPAHGVAFADLQMGVDTRQGFMVLTGEAGTGKTILLHHFLNWLQSRGQSSCYIFQSQLKPVELFESILQDFGVPCSSHRKGDLLAALKRWLVERHALGDSPVLVIDEAQATSVRTLDRLRMLLNLEVPGGKLLQIVLAGQPELEEKLRRPELRQLHQRIMFRCALRELSMEETREYVKARLAIAGGETAHLFSEESLEAVHIYAQGLPRIVNLLCEHAMLNAFAEKQRMITQDGISRVAAVFEFGPRAAQRSGPEDWPRLGRLAPRWPSETAMARTVEETGSEVESQVSVAAAASQNTTVVRPKIQEARPTIIAPGAEKDGVPAVRKMTVATELPVTWERPRANNRFADYWRAVGRSFARDFGQFLRVHSPSKKLPGPGAL
jgi:general secretion pathway protein A